MSKKTKNAIYEAKENSTVHRNMKERNKINNNKIYKIQKSNQSSRSKTKPKTNL